MKMELKTSIIVKFSLEGIHNWPQAKDILPEVSFLSDRHRHMFFFTCKKLVTHSDRDVEIILFKRSIIEYLQLNYGIFCYNNDITTFRYCDFNSMSCEMIAEELVKRFDLESCEVLEDNENGSIVEKLPEISIKKTTYNKYIKL